MKAKYKRVLAHLIACPDHSKESDWYTNRRKQCCMTRACNASLCEHCAGAIRWHAAIDPDPFDLWCTKHAANRDL